MAPYLKTIEELLSDFDKLDCEEKTRNYKHKHYEDEDVIDADNWEINTLEDYEYELTPQEQIEDMFSSFEQENNDEGLFDECDEDDEIFIPKRTPLISREAFARKCMIELAASLLTKSTTKIIRDKEVMKRIAEIIYITPQVELTSSGKTRK